MSEPAFTPGPWAEVEDWDEGTIAIAAPGDATPFAFLDPDREADAYLIIAAPALYEALEAVTDLLDDYYAGSQSVAVTNARAALALARGETP